MARGSVPGTTMESRDGRMAIDQDWFSAMSIVSATWRTIDRTPDESGDGCKPVGVDAAPPTGEATSWVKFGIAGPNRTK